MAPILSFLSFLALAALTTPTPIDPPSCDPTIVKTTQLVGDGSPHQNFVYTQVSGTTDCTDNPSGSASITNTQTVSWSVSISATLDWITGGFDVS
jgi:hypothetical protein